MIPDVSFKAFHRQSSIFLDPCSFNQERTQLRIINHFSFCNEKTMIDFQSCCFNFVSSAKKLA